MQTSVISILLLSLNTAAWAFDTIIVPAGLTGDSAFTKTSIKEDTLVKHSHFSALVPKGWSFRALGDSEKVESVLEISPSTAIMESLIFVRVQLKKTPPKMSLDQRLENYKHSKTLQSPHFTTTNDVKWLVSEFTENGSKNWFSSAIVGGRDYVVIAAVPQKKSADYEKPIQLVMEGIKIY